MAYTRAWMNFEIWPDPSTGFHANRLELGTNFPQSQHLVKDCQFSVSPENYTDKVIMEETTVLPLFLGCFLSDSLQNCR